MRFFQDIFKPAWALAWRNKFLWIFGFFTAALGAGSNYATVAQALDVVTLRSGLSFAHMTDLWSAGNNVFTLENITRFVVEEPLNFLLIALTALLGLCFFALILWIIITSFGSIIFGTKEIAKGEKTSFSDAFFTGKQNFWKLLWITAEAKIAIILALFLVSIPLYFLLTSDSWLSLALYCIAFVVMVIVVLSISFIAFYASAYAVIKNESIMGAWRSGYVLFQKNWLISIEMALLILVANILFGITLFLILLLFSVPISLLSFGFIYLTMPLGIFATQILGGLLYFGIIILSTAFFTTFEMTAWTLLFLKLQKKTQSGLERAVSSLIARFHK